MQQLLHLLLVNPARRTALATCLDQGWGLPIIVASESARIGPLVCRWVRERGEGLPLGQWIGRASLHGALDWLVTVEVHSEALMPAPAGLRWTHLDTLRLSQSLVEYQQWAVARVFAASDLPTVPGPFGNLTWRGEVLCWIAKALGARSASLEASALAHRLGAYEVVLECRSSAGRWFFKGLAPDRATEAVITGALAQMLPNAFPRTVALESRPDGSTWWLMEACPGAPLADRLTLDFVCRVVEAYARVQQAIADRIVAGGMMPAIDLPALVSRAASFLNDGTEQQTVAASRALIDEACWFLSSNLPWSWVAPDLDPTNVIANGEEVRFIDLDDALIGPAPLAIGTFARRVARALGRDHWFPASTVRLVDSYERAWVPRLHLSALWRAIDLVSDLLECELAWRRVEAKVARGEVHGVIEIARRSIRHRLLRAVERYRGNRAHSGCSTAAPIATGRVASETTPSWISQG